MENGFHIIEASGFSLFCSKITKGRPISTRYSNYVMKNAKEFEIIAFIDAEIVISVFQERNFPNFTLGYKKSVKMRVY